MVLKIRHNRKFRKYEDDYSNSRSCVSHKRTNRHAQSQKRVYDQYFSERLVKDREEA